MGVSIQSGLGDRTKQAAAFHTIANIELQGGDLGKSAAAVNSAQEIYKSLGDADGQAACMTTTMDSLLHKGLYVEAIELGTQKVQILHESGNRKGEADAMLSLAKILIANKDFKQADEIAGGALTLMMDVRDRDGSSVAKTLVDDAKRSRVETDIRSQLDANKHLFHVPDALVVDPGMNKRIQEEYNEFVRSRA